MANVPSCICRLAAGGGMAAKISHGSERKKARHVVCAALLIMVSGAGFEPARVLPH